MNATDKAELAQQRLDNLMSDLYATLAEDGSYTFVEDDEDMFERDEEDGK